MNPAIWEYYMRILYIISLSEFIKCEVTIGKHLAHLSIKSYLK